MRGRRRSREPESVEKVSETDKKMSEHKMTSKERILAALHGQDVDHIPFCPFLAYVWESFPQEIRDKGQLAFHHRIGADPLWRGAPCPVKAQLPASVEHRTEVKGDRSVTEIHTPVGVLRQVAARSEDGNTQFLIEHPLKCEQDFGGGTARMQAHDLSYARNFDEMRRD
jgi:hypothetical protein